MTESLIERMKKQREELSGSSSSPIPSQVEQTVTETTPTNGGSLLDRMKKQREELTGVETAVVESTDVATPTDVFDPQSRVTFDTATGEDISPAMPPRADAPVPEDRWLR